MTAFEDFVSHLFLNARNPLILQGGEKLWTDAVIQEIQVPRMLDHLIFNRAFLRLLSQFPPSNSRGKPQEKPEPEKLNWQGSQAQLVYLIEQLYEQGLLSAMLQPNKFELTSKHFTIKGKPLSSQRLAQTKQNNLNNKGGKPKGVEQIDAIVSKALNSENQNGKKI